MRKALVPLLCLLVVFGLPAQKRKNKKDEEPRTQVLAPLPETPEAVVAETARLSFQVSPLSAKGLLSQQIRDALKAVDHDNHGATIVKLRAFVAGSGDLRRVQAIVSDEFTDRKQPLPAVSTIQAGLLPMVGAQVVIEAVSLEKKPVNPRGLALFSGAQTDDPSRAIAELQKSVSAAGVKPADVLKLTCFMSSLDDVAAIRSAVAVAFPSAAASYIQTQRQALGSFAACEAIGRLSAAPSASVVLSGSAALVNAPKLVMTATQLVFRDQDSDIRLAFQRLGKTIEPLGAKLSDVFWAGVFPLTRPTASRIDALRFEFFNPSRPPAGTTLLFEGLPSMDATASIELIAPAR